ncbi:unnamed protein product [Parascedosporium putredinis]|uniref:Uncharacterized protein n=1 Tax=Parascedosporium putredinis TaxID=1442378 RepID=A0A9P1GWH2_9PEZI|nr:unnamed protein product [Parascedosporium putredinis]CAI7989537.1 unnamed protein product [Parascedosporium putredinis]
MKVSNAILLAVLAVEASARVSNTAYNKWHQTELERWLSDHNIPYPAASDRKDLQNIVEKNWDNHVSKGQEIERDVKANKDTLLNRVKSTWYETEDNAQNAWSNVKDWIFDSWSESQLKAFCDKHDIPVPQPRTHDVMLQKVRSNYETVAQKAGETSAYPGDWLYNTWSTSDLKKWLDERGVSVPQPKNRDKLVAAVRRNARIAYLKEQDATSTASEAIQSAFASVSDKVLDTWSESQLKKFCDENAITVPQGTKANELRALIRKHRARVLGEDTAGKFGAATSSAGNQFAKATDSAALMIQDAFDKATGTWSQSRLKSYLDARGIPVPQNSNVDELRALVRKNAHIAAGGWTFDDWSIENLKNYLLSSGDAAAKATAEKATSTRDELLTAAQSAYDSASAAGGAQWSSATSYLAQATATAKANAFDTWSESDLKPYLESYGIPVPQGSTLDQLRAEARKQFTYYRYGTSSPSGTILAKLGESFRTTWDWVAKQISKGTQAAGDAAEELRQEL